MYGCVCAHVCVGVSVPRVCLCAHGSRRFVGDQARCRGTGSRCSRDVPLVRTFIHGLLHVALVVRALSIDGTKAELCLCVEEGLKAVVSLEKVLKVGRAGAHAVSPSSCHELLFATYHVLA